MTSPKSSEDRAAPESAARGGTAPSPTAIERGTYEVIRDRLVALGRELANKADTLNAKRVALFGGTDLTIVGSARIRTENNCVPRDILAVGDRLLFAYNVFLGLKTETRLEDVFSVQQMRTTPEGMEFTTLPLDGPGSPFADARFRTDFDDLHRYYRDARLLNLRRVDNRVLAVFRVGDKLDDVKALRWSVDVQGGLTYVDNQGDRDHVFPPSHDFRWTATTRDDHVSGPHPHVNVLDEVFVETVGGDLTVKIEDNTASGEGVYAEPVEERDQSLDDAQVDYARLGSLILLRVLPYREERRRHLVFNTLTKSVTRIDNIGQACIQLPEDHGIIFPGGYYLQRGETKTFDTDTEGMVYERMVRSPNGEDVLYVFYRRGDGRYVLLPYNLIRKEVSTPIQCHGYCLYEDGRMVVFKALGDEPTRVHPMQIWQTPFTSDVYADKAPVADSPLTRIGNADLVRGISDCLSVRRMTEEQKPSRAMYEALISAVAHIGDTYHWLREKEAGDLASTLKEVRAAADLIVDEFEKVQALRGQAAAALGKAEKDARAVINSLRPDFWKEVDEFVQGLAALRRRRGELISLRQVRYIDLARIDALEAEVVKHFAEVSDKCVAFLLEPEALSSYHDRIAALEPRIAQLEKVTETRPIDEELESISEGLALLTEIVGGLRIDDATVRTRILQGISEIMALGNRVRALLAARRKELASREGVAEFAAQFALFGQSVTSALTMAETPEACDEALSRLLLALEDLEGRFGEFDQFVTELAVKREEVVEAVGGKRQMLLDQRQRRAGTLVAAADRILTGVARRAASLGALEDLNAYFASDAMITKLRDLTEQLRKLDDSVRADEMEARLKTAREDAVRSLRDRQDIFEDGQAVIRLGKHRFSVNTQPLELTMVPRGEGLALHLTGTDFYETVDDPAFLDTRAFWDQEIVSETRDVYRGEYLAYAMLAAAEQQEHGLTLEKLQAAAVGGTDLLDLIREFCSTRYDEGYERGVHDADAARILSGLLGPYRTAGLLRFAAVPRAAGALFWARYDDAAERDRLAREARSLGRLRTVFRRSAAIAEIESALSQRATEFCEQNELPLDPATGRQVGRYLFEQLATSPDRFVVSADALTLLDAFLGDLSLTGARHEFEDDLRRLDGRLRSRYRLAKAWVEAWLDAHPERAALRPSLPETAGLIVAGDRDRREASSAMSSVVVEGLLGQHARIASQRMELRLDEFLGRLSTFANERVPAYRAYQERRHTIVTKERERLRLSEFKPRVMSAFVRNRLIDEVYLPIIGSNLAKQLGALGSTKRTDLMGLLLLISPPGYGKTTLMEYVANRLGLVFMKINGPALGHGVRSLDPAEAGNATARQEVEKIGLALEMGTNVMLYVDDIQHTHPEFLQKFISLCDAQRKIEGVWRGRTRTYDMRGKKFVVVMAGNPYTESGETFKIPDMLANRADVYNLGDILGGKDELFALSYVENALTSNPVLAQIATNAHQDVLPLVRMAHGEDIPASSLAHPYSQVELEEILSVLRKVLRCQEVLLKVNAAYIASASMDDAYRTEPPFKLQGSYRNMNKLAERIVPVMNDAELEQLLVDHFVGEAQTLTTDAEQNLLKLAELRGRMTGEQRARWDSIREGFRRRQMMGGDEEDPVTRVTGQLVALSEHVKDVGAHIRDAAGRRVDTDVGEELGAALAPYLEKLQTTIAAFENGARAAVESAQRAPVEAAPPDREELSHMLAPYVERLDRVLSGLAERPAPARPAEPLPQVPAAPVEHDPNAIVRYQVQVIEAGLLPVLRSLNYNLKINKAVWERMDSVLAALRRLTGEEPPAPIEE